jgi:hypothetical protein
MSTLLWIEETIPRKEDHKRKMNDAGRRQARIERQESRVGQPIT